jgi:hypothetical protein
VVDDHVAQRAHWVVEMAAVLDAEALGHRDLDVRDVVPVPDRLEHRVAEPEEEDLVEAHLPQVVVDAEELRLVDRLVQLVGERAGGREVVAERLLHHHVRALREPRVGEALHDGREQRRRDLEVVHRPRRALDGLPDAVVRCGVGEVA